MSKVSKEQSALATNLWNLGSRRPYNPHRHLSWQGQLLKEVVGAVLKSVQEYLQWNTGRDTPPSLPNPLAPRLAMLPCETVALGELLDLNRAGHPYLSDVATPT